MPYRRVVKRASGSELLRTQEDRLVTADYQLEGAGRYFLSGVSDHQPLGP